MTAVGSARAQGGPVEPVRFSYAATDGCPQQDVFVGQVMARTARARLAQPGEASRTFVVSVQRGDAEYTGTLTVTQPSGEASVRRVSAPICDEVVEALAVVAALTVDPQANTQPASELPAAGARQPPAAAPPAEPLPAPVPPAPAPTAPAPAPPPLVSDARTQPAPAPASPAEPAPLSLAVGAQLDFRSGLAPSWTFAPRAFVDLGASGPGLLSPRAGLSLSGWSNRVEGELGDARFDWFAARAEGCPANLATSPAAALRPCVSLEAGVLRGAGLDADSSDLDETASEAWTWLAVGLLARLEVLVADALQMRAEAGAVVPLVRPSFVFERPDRTEEVFEVPLLAPHVGLGLGVPLRL